MRQDEDDSRLYSVVINHEEQYSIWLADRDAPAGWRSVGMTGQKAECLAHIKEVWTDMRPLSLRLQMAEHEKNPPEVLAAPVAPSSDRPLNELVERLQTLQPIEATARPERLVRHFKESLDRGVFFVKFVNTGTELGIRLEADGSDLSKADFLAESGSASLVGTLTLNYNKVRFRGDVELPSLAGTGRLEFIEAVRPGSL